MGAKRWYQIAAIVAVAALLAGCVALPPYERADSGKSETPLWIKAPNGNLYENCTDSSDWWPVEKGEAIGSIGWKTVWFGGVYEVKDDIAHQCLIVSDPFLDGGGELFFCIEGFRFPDFNRSGTDGLQWEDYDSGVQMPVISAGGVIDAFFDCFYSKNTESRDYSYLDADTYGYYGVNLYSERMKGCVCTLDVYHIGGAYWLDDGMRLIQLSDSLVESIRGPNGAPRIEE